MGDLLMNPTRVSPPNVAVGTSVARRPPLRSVREAFPHTAPASGPTRKRTDG